MSLFDQMHQYLKGLKLEVQRAIKLLELKTLENAMRLGIIFDEADGVGLSGRP